MICEIPLRTQSEANRRDHWAARHRRVKGQRDAVALCLGLYDRPSLPCVVRLTRLSPRELDDDNLRSSLKAIRDEVARWLCLPVGSGGQVDDRDPRVRWEYGQARAREYGVRIEAWGLA